MTINHQEERRALSTGLMPQSIDARAESLMDALRGGRGAAAVMDVGPLPDWARKALVRAASRWNDGDAIPAGHPPPTGLEGARLLGRLLCEASHIQASLQATDPRVKRLVLVLDPVGLLPLTVSRGGTRFGLPRESDCPLILRGNPAVLIQVLSSHSSRHLLWAGATGTISIEGSVVSLAVLGSLLDTAPV